MRSSVLSFPPQLGFPDSAQNSKVESFNPTSTGSRKIVEKLTVPGKSASKDVFGQCHNQFTIVKYDKKTQIKFRVATGSLMISPPDHLKHQ
jgi:hypothetical protein